MVIDGKMSFDKYLEYEAGQKKSEYEKAGQAMKKMYKKATE
jgi:DNA anti-recombination protein RmuC